MRGFATERRHPIRIERASVPPARLPASLPAFRPALLPALAATGLAAILPACRLGHPNVPRAGAIEVSTLGDADVARFAAALDAAALPPLDYVRAKFRDHDLVLLGELHEVREVCAWIGDLLAPLYHDAGVRVLALECLRDEDSNLANRIATSPQPQPAALRDLFRDAIWPLWGFQEYLDIVEAARALNASLPPGAEKLRVIGLGNTIDLHDVLCGPWWSKGDDLWKMSRNDAFMASILEREVLDRDKKALVQVGSMHSFPRYRQPIVAKGKLAREAGPRMGDRLHDTHGDRVFQILLHQWHFGPELVTSEDAAPRQPLGGFLEEVFAARANEPAGFDIEGSPFAMLRDESSYYFAFQRYSVFSDLAQGYVFLRPLEDLHRVQWVEGFLDAEHFERARDIALAKGWITEEACRTPQELNERMKQVVEED